jgi:hypothetical protein
LDQGTTIIIITNFGTGHVFGKCLLESRSTRMRRLADVDEERPLQNIRPRSQGMESPAAAAGYSTCARIVKSVEKI